jgi:hypothetical protein
MDSLKEAGRGDGPGRRGGPQSSKSSAASDRCARGRCLSVCSDLIGGHHQRRRGGPSIGRPSHWRGRMQRAGHLRLKPLENLVDLQGRRPPPQLLSPQRPVAEVAVHVPTASARSREITAAAPPGSLPFRYRCAVSHLLFGTRMSPTAGCPSNCSAAPGLRDRRRLVASISVLVCIPRKFDERGWKWRTKWARSAEMPKQPSLGLQLRAPYLYPGRAYSATRQGCRPR